MRSVDTESLLSIPEVARRLGVSNEDAFDLAFVTRDLPLVARDNDLGVPQDAVEAYRRTRARS